MKLYFSIPNLFTLANLFCGCMGIVFVFFGKIEYSAYLIFFAAFFDFLDGFAARLLKIPSEIGKQLDSLADMVTFGVLPGIILFKLLTFSFCLDGVDSESAYLYGMIAFMIPMFSALRLAKFNIDTNQSDTFIGVPTPAVTFFIGGLVLVLMNLESSLKLTFPMSNEGIGGLIGTEDLRLKTGIIDTYLNPIRIIGLIVIASFSMIIPVPMLNLKFKNFAWKGNQIRYIFLGSCALTIIIALFMKFLWIALPIIIFLYVLISIINNTVNKDEI